MAALHGGNRQRRLAAIVPRREGEAGARRAIHLRLHEHLARRALAHKLTLGMRDTRGMKRERDDGSAPPIDGTIETLDDAIELLADTRGRNGHIVYIDCHAKGGVSGDRANADVSSAGAGLLCCLEASLRTHLCAINPQREGSSS